MPAPLRLFILRHGQTDFNRQDIIQGGGIDSDLNDTGREQSQLFYQRYRDTPFVAGYVSGLKRTRQTLAPWAEVGLRPLSLLELNELSWGVLEGKHRDEQTNEVIAHTLRTWGSGHTNYAVRGGESPEQVWDRVAPRLDYIINRHREGNVLICTHGRTLRVMLSQMLGYGLRHMQRFPHENTGLNILRYSGGRYIPERINDTSHLL